MIKAILLCRMGLRQNVVNPQKFPSPPHIEERWNVLLKKAVSKRNTHTGKPCGKRTGIPQKPP
jgi:hypothetical protein